MTITYLTRADWGGGPLRRGHVVDEAQFTALRVHHTVIVMPDYDRDGFLHGDLDDIKRYMRALQVARPDLGSEVPYSFVPFPGATEDDCIIAAGRGPGVTGAHTQGQNSWTYGVSCPGNYEHETPTRGQVAGVRWIGAKFLKRPLAASVTLGHYQVPGEATACPGRNTKPLLSQMQPPFTAADLSGGSTFDSEEQMGPFLFTIDAKTFYTCILGVSLTKAGLMDVAAGNLPRIQGDQAAYDRLVAACKPGFFGAGGGPVTVELDAEKFLDGLAARLTK